MEGLYIGLALLSFAVLIAIGRYLHNTEEAREAGYERQRESDLVEAEVFKRSMAQRAHGVRVEARQAERGNYEDRILNNG